MKKQTKKILVSAAITIALVGFQFGIRALADSYTTDQITDYLKNNGFDLLGMDGENLYFYLRDIEAGNDPIRMIAFDIRYFKEGFLVSYKGLSDNQLVYGLFGTAGWLLSGKSLLSILKLIKPF